MYFEKRCSILQACVILYATVYALRCEFLLLVCPLYLLIYLQVYDSVKLFFKRSNCDNGPCRLERDVNQAYLLCGFACVKLYIYVTL